MATIDLSSFFEKVKIQSYEFKLSENLISSKDGSGQILVSSVGPRIWKGKISISPMPIRDWNRFSVVLQQIQNPVNTFLVYDKKNQQPYNSLASHNFTNAKVSRSANSGYDATLTGLPANFKISIGDYFSIIIGGIHQLFQIAGDVTANASGAASVKLLNPMPTNTPANSTAIFRKATVTARYLPNSMNIGQVTTSHFEGANFEWIQSFKS